MDFSFFFFANNSASEDRYQLLLDSTRFADAHGFSAVWTPERHFHSFGGQFPNAAVTGAALAAITERVGIRAGSVVAPLHHPVRIAEEWSVVDNLSAGRAGVSFASGWHATDFVLKPENYRDRKKIMVESVATVRRLWRGEEVEFPDPEGGHRAVRLFPPPVRPDLPVWITSGGTPDTFRTAGTLGAGVLTHQLGQSHDALASNIVEYRKQLAASHGAGERGHVVLMLHTLIGADRDEVRGLVREPFGAYLLSSFDLIVRESTGPDGTGFDPRRMSDDDKAFLVERSFDRYFSAAGLFGTVEDGAAVVRRLEAIGVNEIACLIDFGVTPGTVLESLRYLDELRRHSGGDTPGRLGGVD